jgi:uncharacterized protein (TIGR03000 family)
MFPCRLSFNRLSIGAVAVALLAGGAALAQDGRAVTPGSSADARARREASLLPSGRPATPEGHEALAPIYTPIFLTSINYPRIYGARTYDTRPTYFTSINYPETYGAFTYGPGGSFYPATPSLSVTSSLTPRRVDATAHLDVYLPASAELWVNGVRLNQTGSLRLIDSPALDLGRTYSYRVTARWTEDGRDVARTRDVDVVAGDRLALDLRNREERPPPAPTGTATLRPSNLPLR